MKKSKLFEEKLRLKGEYERRYIVDMALVTKINCSLKLREETCLHNYKFYMEKIETKLHSKRGDYRFLEDRHDYIQWMFPNHYESAFNYNSHPLGYL